MTLEEFLNTIHRDEKQIDEAEKGKELPEIVIGEQITLQKETLYHGLIIENFTFKEDVFFKDMNLGYQLVFRNCKFEKKLLFSYCTTIDTSNFYDTDYQILFDNSSISILNIIHTTIKNGLIIDNNCQIGELYISSLVSINSFFIIESSTIKDKFFIFNTSINNFTINRNSTINTIIKFTNNTINDKLSFLESNFLKDIRIEGGIVNNLILDKCTFQEKINLKPTNINLVTSFNTTFKEKLEILLSDNKAEEFNLSFVESLFSKEVYIHGGIIKELVFNKGEFNENIIINTKKIHLLTVLGTTFKKPIDMSLNEDKEESSNTIINSIHIKSGKFEESFIINGNERIINLLTIEASRQLQGSIYINDLKISKTLLLGENYSSNLVFNNCYFNDLSFDSFHNYSTISLISTKSFNKNARIFINNSNLGKTHFFNVLFNTFPNIEINHSTLTDIISANTLWFEDSQLNKSASSKTDYEQKREIYRQLKYALEKQGNIIASLWFKTMEMKMYKKQLFIGRTWLIRIFGIDRFILWVSQSNSFGQNWVKPVLLLLGSSLFFQLLITIGISPKLDYSFNLNLESLKLTWQEYCKYFNKFPQLLDPTQSLDKVFPDNKNIKSSAPFWYFLAKITNTFFGFQILTAFRKFVR